MIIMYMDNRNKNYKKCLLKKVLDQIKKQIILVLKK